MMKLIGVLFFAGLLSGQTVFDSVVRIQRNPNDGSGGVLRMEGQSGDALTYMIDCQAGAAYPCIINGTTIQNDRIKINEWGSGDRNALIDFRADDINATYSMRLVRDPGVNGGGGLLHKGSGTLVMYTVNGANIGFFTNSVERWNFGGATGHLVPAADLTYNLGSASFRLANAWINNVYGTQFGSGTNADVTFIRNGSGVALFNSSGVLMPWSDGTLGIGSASIRSAPMYATLFQANNSGGSNRLCSVSGGGIQCYDGSSNLMFQVSSATGALTTWDGAATQSGLTTTRYVRNKDDTGSCYNQYTNGLLTASTCSVTP